MGCSELLDISSGNDCQSSLKKLLTQSCISSRVFIKSSDDICDASGREVGDATICKKYKNISHEYTTKKIIASKI